jgi:hypothetical protein
MKSMRSAVIVAVGQPAPSAATKAGDRISDGNYRKMSVIRISLCDFGSVTAACPATNFKYRNRRRSTGGYLG